MTGLPRDRKHPHEDALSKAWEDLSRRDVRELPPELREDLGCDGALLTVRILDRTCRVDPLSRTIRYAPVEEEVPPHLQVLILHYLLGASPPLTDRWVSFRELDGGAMYYPAFRARAVDPLVKAFGNRPELLEMTAGSLGAEPLDIGHVSFRLRFFDRLPVAVVLWLGDDEVPASASILFDASANRMLPTEDLTVVGGTTSRSLIDRSKAH